ncbi:PAS domain S-box protein [Daejeonella lutea]|uniref:histidine kinase n=1 Tax=Daejeonella lutea TaxID=572036 RepID=A0A1T5BH89_9SPHI|nr:PAS domain S-box protein [Daejeonella lutea]SKB46661.1 PAS domain S-box-containing protein [Daejeonella lutea]
MSKKLPGDQYKEIFYNSPATMLIIDIDAPNYTMLDVNNAYLAATNTTREDLIGKPVFGVFPENPTDNISKNIERTIFSFHQAITSKKAHVMSNYRYDIPIPGTNEFEERYWTTSNTPVLDDNGEVIYFIHSPLDVTELYKLSEREKAGITALRNQEEMLHNTFMQAPVGIGIFKGPDYIVDLINPPLSEIYGKTMEEMAGKNVFDVLAHAKGMGFEALLDNVRLTGEPFKGAGMMVPLMRKGKLETVYVDFVYEPYRESDGTISGVIALATEVTDQVNAKQQIADAEERARLAVDAVGLGTYDLNLLTGEMFTTRQFANIFGFDEPVSRRKYVTVFDPDDLDQREQAHKDALKTGELFYEARVIWKDKSVHWVRVEGKVIYQGKKPVRILGTLLDITEQRIAKEEQRKLITLVDNSVDLMSILNLQGINSYINKAGKDLLGFTTDEEVRSTPIGSLHLPEDLEIVERDVLPTVMKEGSWSGQMRVKHLKTGEVFPVFNNCIRIDDPVSGDPIAVGAVMRDLRPELAAKQALAESEQLLRTITTAAPTALWMADEQGLVTYNNQTWLDWTGRSFEENLGWNWLESVHEDDRNRVKDKILSDLAEKHFYEVEFRLLHSDGKIHWCVTNGQPQYRADGTFSGYIGACVDITEQKHLQQQKDDFIGIASHELKTPVTSIKAYTQVLEKILSKKGETKEAEMISRMDGQINRLTSLIGDLLDVTKINSGKLQFNDRDFQFIPMVKELIEDLQRTTDKHLLVEEYEGDGLVFGDKERIGQVISNLITNAIKYSPNSEKIIIHTSVKEDEIKLCVTDFGIGISQDKLEKVFEQFYRVSGNMQHTFPGLGLGLYISSEIIKREGGRIWVTSAEGKGSTFCFALPLAADNVPDN